MRQKSEIHTPKQDDEHPQYAEFPPPPPPGLQNPWRPPQWSNAADEEGRWLNLLKFNFA